MSPTQAIAFVHHANQLVIGNGYRDRDGITQIVAGYRRILRGHRDFGIPAALHLSGSLVEALAWHHPDFLHEIRQAVEHGWLKIVGGCYAEPILPLARPDTVRRQIALMATLLERHLGIPGGAASVMWLPERVWDPSLTALLSDPQLPGGGFRYVFVDDRVMARSPEHRAALDKRGPYRWPLEMSSLEITGAADPEVLRPRLVGNEGRCLTLVPLSAHLRYLIPPPSPSRRAALADFVDDVSVRAGQRGCLLVYGDDLERTSGTGGWSTEPDAYIQTLRWVAEHSSLEAVHVDDWIEANPCDPGPPPAAGAYYELAVDWGAGEDYRNWADDARWIPFSESLRRAEEDLELARSGGCDARLAALAERLIFIGNYETGWQERERSGLACAPTGWVQSCASHAATGRPILAAARWATGPACPPTATKMNWSAAGPELIVLANDHIWCLVTPDDGARVCLLAHRNRELTSIDSPERDGAALVVGNPADDWNLQQDPYRYMDEPAAHPGAFTDLARPHTQWIVDHPRCSADAVTVDLHAQSATRRYAVVDGIPAIVACVLDVDPISLSSLVSPDYLGSLAEGQYGIHHHQSNGRATVQCDGRSAWLVWDPRQAGVQPRVAKGWHGHLITVTAAFGHIDVLLGAGPVDDRTARGWLDRARRALHGEGIVRQPDDQTP